MRYIQSKYAQAYSNDNSIDDANVVIATIGQSSFFLNLLLFTLIFTYFYFYYDLNVFR